MPRYRDTPCLLCGSKSRRVLYQTADVNMLGPGTFQVVRCRECALCYTTPQPAPEDMHLWYPPEYFVASLEEGQRAVLNRGLQLLLESMTTGQGGKSVLDVGCGVGNLMRVLQRQGWDVWGVDTSAHVCDTARRTLGDRVMHSTLEEAAFPDARFDAVVLADVLEHLHNPLATLTEVRRVLRPSGRAYFKVPNFAAWQARVCGRWWYGLDVPRHLLHFTPDTLRAMLTRVGFSGVAVRPVGGPIGGCFLEFSVIHRLRALQMARRGQTVSAGSVVNVSEVLEGNVYSTVPSSGKRAFRWALRNVVYAPLALENVAGQPVMLLAGADR